MSDMDRKWAHEQLDTSIQMTAYLASSTSGVLGSFVRGRSDKMAGQAQVMEQILERAIPVWRSPLRETSRKWDGSREAASRGRAQLQQEQEQELGEKLGENAPRSAAENLYPWCWSGARLLWQSGYFGQAVRHAAPDQNAETENRGSRRGVGEMDLFKQSFSVDEVKPGKAWLRRMTREASDTYRSLQGGVMAFAEGVFAGARNPLSREVDQEISDQVALEHLTALSVLARRADESTVEPAGGQS